MAAFTTINDSEAYFQTVIYTGNKTARALTFDGDTDMQPDLVWTKNRDATYNHVINDAVRGVGETIYPSVTTAEESNSEGVTAFSSDGYSIGDSDYWNKDADKYVAWCWKESATAGFDIVAHTGTGSAHTISHSLSAKPHMIINKGRSSAHQWMVQHHSLGATLSLILEGNLAQDDSATQWNDTEPTSSVFTVGTNGQLNTSDATYITYLFTSIQGYS